MLGDPIKRSISTRNPTVMAKPSLVRRGRRAVNRLAIASVLLAASSLSAPVLAQAAAVPAAEDALAAGFADPPSTARPRVWWHWMNGNVTKDGIAKDIAWMKRVGIGGLQNFDANLTTPQIVPERLVYMHHEWKDAFRFAASLAEQQGLELAIAASPGWSETGGPWVEPKDGLKKLVWSETTVPGGKRFADKLASPPNQTGPFQALPVSDPLAAATGVEQTTQPSYYKDVAVLAYPAAPFSEAAPHVSLDGKPVDAAALTDDDLLSALDVPQPADGAATSLVFDYDQPLTIRSATLYLAGARGLFSRSSVKARLESSPDGQSWQPVAPIAVEAVPTTISFAPITAKRFRLLLEQESAVSRATGDPVPGAANVSFIPGPSGKPVTHIAKFTLSPEAKVDQFERKAGFALATDYFALGTPPEAPGVDLGKVIDLTSRLQPNGMLDWTPPAGTWRILRLGYSLVGTTNHPATPEATGLEVDKYDGPAVRNYLEHYIDMYRDAAGPDLIGAHGVRAIVTDSIEVGAANWTPRMIDQFKALRGYDPTPWLPALTGTIIASRTQSDAFLYDFRRTLADLMASEHYGTVAEVAHEHDLKVYGEALEDGRPSLGDDMAMRANADVPMSAMWTYGRQAGPKPTYLADDRGAASVAHIYGQNIVAAESMTAARAPWAYAPNNLRRIIDLEFALGINRPVIHTSVHQPVDDKLPGLSLAIFGQYFNRHETWAEMAKPWVDYIARNSFMLQQGRDVADVAYFYGEEAPLTGLFVDHPVPDAPRRYGFDFVNADVLKNQIDVQDSELIAKKGSARYRAIYLGGSSARMTFTTLARLAELAEAGATIVGQPPTGSPGLQDNPMAYRALVARLWGGGKITTIGRGRIIASSDIEAALGSLGIEPDFDYVKSRPDSELLFLHRHTGDADIYYVDNRADRTAHAEARFRVTGRVPELWHADTGRSEAVSYRVDGNVTIVPLELAADESVFVVFRKQTAQTSATVTKPATVTLTTISGHWSVAFQPNRGAPASTSLASLGSLSEQADPRIRYFSGVATYTNTFVLPKNAKPGTSLWLDLGQVAEVAEVRINGVLVGTAWHAPYRVDIAKAVKRGRNSLDVRVANLWINRLIGDQQKGATKVTWTALPTYRQDAPLRPSGLIGPVTLLSNAK